MVRLYAKSLSSMPDPMSDFSVLEGLPKERKEKVLKYRVEKARKQSAGAGLLLRDVLAGYGLTEKDVYLGKNGKPLSDKICFNVSHTDGMVICAVSDLEVGCDIELIRPMNENIVNRFFCKSEADYLKSMHHERVDAEFFRLWTIKESYMKMTGEGMYLPLDAFEILISNEIKIMRDNVVQDCNVSEYYIEGYKVSVCAVENKFDNVVEYL